MEDVKSARHACGAHATSDGRDGLD